MNFYFKEVYIDNLAESSLDQLYNIHACTYLRKNTGLEKKIWISNLKKYYHNNTKKQLFIFSHLGTNNLLDGYIITAGVQIINHQSWVKILEGAASPNKNYISPTQAFTEMFEYFLNISKKKQWNLWGEVSLEHLGIFKLLINYGFSPIDDIKTADFLYQKFIPEKFRVKIISVSNTLELEVERETQLTPNYKGKLINFNQRDNINKITQNHHYEYH